MYVNIIEKIVFIVLSISCNYFQDVMYKLLFINSMNIIFNYQVCNKLNLRTTDIDGLLSVIHLIDEC